MNGLESLTRQQVIDLLRQQYADGVGAISGEPDYNGFVSFAGLPGVQARRVDNPVAALLAQAGQGTGIPGTTYYADLTPNFDQAGEGGQYGRYVGQFNPDGSLYDVQFQQGQRSGGFVADNMEWLGPLLVGGAAALGGGLFSGIGGAGGSGVSAADIAAAAGSPELGLAPQVVSGAAPITASTPSWIAGVGSTAGMTPAQIEAAQVAAGIGTAASPLAGGLSAADLARYAGTAGSLLSAAGGSGLPAATTTPSSDVQVSTDALNALFGNRDDIYQQVYDNAYGLSSERLNESREKTLRDLRFGLARTGLTGGSAAVDAQGLEQREFGRALMDASNAAQGQADQVKANDEKTRLSLISQMRAGMSSADATQSALAQMSDNVNAAKAQQPYSAADAYMAAISPTINNYQITQGVQRARSAHPGLASDYRGTIVR